MSEPSIVEPEVPPVPIQLTADEQLAKLKPIHEEALARATSRKARIVELESTVSELQGKLATSEELLRQVTVELPLNTMAESLATNEELWLQQWNKHYKLQLVKGQLTIMSAADNKPVKMNGSPLPFTREALSKFLTEANSPQARSFKGLIVYSRASGAAGAVGPRRTNQSSDAKDAPTHNFGFR